MTDMITPPELLTHYILRVNGIESGIGCSVRDCESILEEVETSWEGKAPEELKQKLEEFIFEYKKAAEELFSAEQALRSINILFE